MVHRPDCPVNITYEVFVHSQKTSLKSLGGGVISIPEGDLFFFVYLLLLQGGVFYQYKKL